MVRAFVVKAETERPVLYDICVKQKRQKGRINKRGTIKQAINNSKTKHVENEEKKEKTEKKKKKR